MEVDKLRKGADYRLWLKDLTEEKDIVDFMDVETNRMAVGDFREIGDRIGTWPDVWWSWENRSLEKREKSRDGVGNNVT